jgi:hypothetical protein
MRSFIEKRARFKFQKKINESIENDKIKANLFRVYKLFSSE